MFIGGVVNCSPLARDLQLTGVKVLFNKFLWSSAHDCGHMVHGSGAMVEYYYDKRTEQNYIQLNFGYTDPFNHACTLRVYIDSCTRHSKPTVSSKI